ncbi:scavenger receptor class F member 1-like [Haliotis asinina]|uniref:scavenger receptor class F member 1-like n=1 Tax=Haliotis asinina TaxID=109174 RepID=UPI003531CAC2
MFITVTLCLLTFASTKAARCEEYPHCAACDSQKRTCTSCHSGYHGSTCELVCNIGCRHGACELTSRGIENCTEGCVAGFRGPNCKVPCSPPPELCQECPGGCQEGYCQLGSSCVSGCKDGFYGATCKDCSSTCKTCNRTIGTCLECHQSHFGSNCSYPCNHCHVSCKFGCEQGCAPGFHGSFCENNCSEHCRGESDANGAMVSLPECSRETGDCIKGCVDGWYGPSCSSQCNPRCKYKRCFPSGDCQHGCVPGYYGSVCSPCPKHCVDNTCDTESGTCQRCDNGLYGLFCNQNCSVCLDGFCVETSTVCPDGCNIRGDRCVSTCTNNCTETGDHTSSKTYSIQNVIPTALCIISLVVTMCVLHRKRLLTDSARNQVSLPPSLPPPTLRRSNPFHITPLLSPPPPSLLRRSVLLLSTLAHSSPLRSTPLLTPLPLHSLKDFLLPPTSPYPAGPLLPLSVVWAALGKYQV